MMHCHVAAAAWIVFQSRKPDDPYKAKMAVFASQTQKIGRQQPNAAHVQAQGLGVLANLEEDQVVLAIPHGLGNSYALLLRKVLGEARGRDSALDVPPGRGLGTCLFRLCPDGYDLGFAGNSAE